MIKKINRISIGVGVVFSVIILIGFRNIDYLLAYLLGFLASNLCFFINYNFLQVERGLRASLSNVSFNFTIRISIYLLTLLCVAKFFPEYSILFAFVGCLCIRISIIIYGFMNKGGKEDEFE